jgi:hypothetical protein
MNGRTKAVLELMAMAIMLPWGNAASAAEQGGGAKQQHVAGVTAIKESGIGCSLNRSRAASRHANRGQTRCPAPCNSSLGRRHVP